MKKIALDALMVLIAASAGCYDTGGFDDSGAGAGDAYVRDVGPDGDDSGVDTQDSGNGGSDAGEKPDSGGADAGQPPSDAGEDAGTIDGGPQDAGPSADAETPTPLSDTTPGWNGQLAYSPTSKSWLVATMSGGIVGRMMGNDGIPIGAVFAVSPADQNASWVPSVAYAPDVDKFLVVWVDYTNNGWQAWGRFVNGDGTMPGDAFALSLDKPVANQGGDRTSSLAYDSKNKRFVYAWHGTHLVNIDMSGNIGPVVDIVDGSPNEHWSASVAANPDTNEYCVAYDKRNAGTFAVTGVDASTLTAGAETVANVTTTNVLVAYNTVERTYVVVYDTGYATGVRAMVLGSCDLNDQIREFDILPKVAWTSVAYNPASNMFAVISQNANGDGNTFAVFDSSGVVLATGDPYLGGSNGNFSPEIAPNTDDGTFAAISSREYSQTRFTANIGFK
ncbi:MAG: hypothetical protein HY897_20450, partial [Deltaproteobacteria bacterium]|nr:hypothetical protein [Deltaproteobacteria bacterium]